MNSPKSYLFIIHSITYPAAVPSVQICLFINRASGGCSDKTSASSAGYLKIVPR